MTPLSDPADHERVPADWTEDQRALRLWYATGLGRELHQRVAKNVELMLHNVYALHCLQIGGTQLGVDLLAGRALIHRIHVTGDGADGIRAHPTQLPFASRSLDLVVLCHALEFSTDPHGLLREVDRVLALDGHVLVVGFNPWSLFGLRRLWDRSSAPWCGRFYRPGRVTDWLSLLGMRVRQTTTVWPGPPLQADWMRRRIGALDAAGRLVPWVGAVYVALARKHSMPLTPVLTRRERTREPVTVPGGMRPAGRSAASSPVACGAAARRRGRRAMRATGTGSR